MTLWLVLLLVLLWPWGVVRWALIPLGQVRLAAALTRLCWLRFMDDSAGGAALAAAWALLRRPPGTAARRAGRAWLVARTAAWGRDKARGAGVTALGLLAAEQGELESARGLLRALDTLDPRYFPRQAQLVSREWLAAESAERGAWAEVAALSAAGSMTRTTRLLGLIAARRLAFAGGDAARAAGDPVPSARALWNAWLLCGHRALTLPLVRRALMAVPPAAQAPPAAVVQTSEEPLAQALRQHARLQAALALPAGDAATSAGLAGALQELGAAWERALAAPTLRRHLLERGLLLGVSAAGVPGSAGKPGAAGAEAALAALREEAAVELAELLRRAGLPLTQVLPVEPAGSAPARPPAPTVLSRAAQRRREALMAEVEARCDALRDRTGARRELPIVDEWREWAALRARYERAVLLLGTGLEVRRVLWSRLHSDVCSYAVWLWNQRKERALANAVFRYLLREAEHLGDQDRIDLQKKNVACG